MNYSKYSRVTKNFGTTPAPVFDGLAKFSYDPDTFNMVMSGHDEDGVLTTVVINLNDVINYVMNESPEVLAEHKLSERCPLYMDAIYDFEYFLYGNGRACGREFVRENNIPLEFLNKFEEASKIVWGK